MSARARQLSERTQAFTSFTAILERLVRSCAGVLGAAFVDAEGETVDYAGTVDSFAIKVAAAHMRIILHEAADLPALGASIRELTIRGTDRGFLIRAMPEGYAIVLVLSRRVFSVSSRAMQLAEHELIREAVLPIRDRRETIWRLVDVETSAGDRRRPGKLRLGSEWEALETILGLVAGLPSRERGFRVRLQSGAELTLVREPHARWYADELPADHAEGGHRQSTTDDPAKKNLDQRQTGI